MKLLFLNLIFCILLINFKFTNSFNTKNDNNNNNCDLYISNYLNEKCIQFSIAGIDNDNLNQENLRGNLKLVPDEQILIPIGQIINSVNSNLKTFCNSKGLLQPIADHLKIKDFILNLNGTIKINNHESKLNCYNEIITFKILKYSYIIILKSFKECPNILNIGEPCVQKDDDDNGILSGLKTPTPCPSIIPIKPTPTPTPTPSKLPICAPRDNPLESNYCPGSFVPIEKNGGGQFKIKLDVIITKRGQDKFGDPYFEHKVTVTNNEEYDARDIRIHSDKFLQYIPYHSRFANGDFLVPRFSSLLYSETSYIFTFNCTHEYPTLTVVNLVRGVPPPRYT